MAKISAGFAVPVGGELDTADLQGIGLYRGKEVKKSRLDSDVDFELHPEEPEHEGKSAGSKKGELKLSFLKREKGSFAEGEEELPDFDAFSNSPGFQRFMAQLRRSKQDGSYEELSETLDSLFDDPTLKYAALTGALKLIDEEGGDPALKKLLEEMLQTLTDQKGPEVRAGYNVSKVAAGTVGAQGEQVASLRDFYCQVIFSDQSLVDLYYYIMDHFPDDVEALKRKKEDEDQKKDKKQPKERLDGPEGQARLEKALEFLLKSLGAELKSNRPSLEHPLLQKVTEGLCQMEFLRNAYRAFLQMLRTMHKENAEIPVAPSRLIDELLGRVNKDIIQDDEFLKVAEQFSVPPLQLSIEFLTRIYEMVRLFPERIFPSSKNREMLLTAVQHALDSAIARENEVA